MESGTQWRLRLELLERLRVRDFREGNTIDDVFVFRGSQCPADLVALAYGLDSPVPEPWFGDVLERVSQENWTLLYLHCSYGGDLVALAKGDMSVSEDA